MAMFLRLLNLPNEANNMDIREFFAGFDIPNGGVQIIGGPNSEALIWFVHGKDLLKGLELDRRCILGQPVRLLVAKEKKSEKTSSVSAPVSVMPHTNLAHRYESDLQDSGSEPLPQSLSRYSGRQLKATHAEQWSSMDPRQSMDEEYDRHREGSPDDHRELLSPPVSRYEELHHHKYPDLYAPSRNDEYSEQQKYPNRLLSATSRQSLINEQKRRYPDSPPSLHGYGRVVDERQQQYADQSPPSSKYGGYDEQRKYTPSPPPISPLHRYGDLIEQPHIYQEMSGQTLHGYGAVDKKRKYVDSPPSRYDGSDYKYFGTSRSGTFEKKARLPQTPPGSPTASPTLGDHHKYHSKYSDYEDLQKSRKGGSSVNTERNKLTASLGTYPSVGDSWEDEDPARNRDLRGYPSSLVHSEPGALPWITGEQAQQAEKQKDFEAYQHTLKKNAKLATEFFTPLSSTSNSSTSSSSSSSSSSNESDNMGKAHRVKKLGRFKDQASAGRDGSRKSSSRDRDRQRRSKSHDRKGQSRSRDRDRRKRSKSRDRDRRKRSKSRDRDRRKRSKSRDRERRQSRIRHSERSTRSRSSERKKARRDVVENERFDRIAGRTRAITASKDKLKKIKKDCAAPETKPMLAIDGMEKSRNEKQLTIEAPKQTEIKVDETRPIASTEEKKPIETNIPEEKIEKCTVPKISFKVLKTEAVVRAEGGMTWVKDKSLGSFTGQYLVLLSLPCTAGIDDVEEFLTDYEIAEGGIVIRVAEKTSTDSSFCDTLNAYVKFVDPKQRVDVDALSRRVIHFKAITVQSISENIFDQHMKKEQEEKAASHALIKASLVAVETPEVETPRVATVVPPTRARPLGRPPVAPTITCPLGVPPLGIPNVAPATPLPGAASVVVPLGVPPPAVPTLSYNPPLDPYAGYQQPASSSTYRSYEGYQQPGAAVPYIAGTYGNYMSGPDSYHPPFEPYQRSYGALQSTYNSCAQPAPPGIYPTYFPPTPHPCGEYQPQTPPTGTMHPYRQPSPPGTDIQSTGPTFPTFVNTEEVFYLHMKMIPTHFSAYAAKVKYIDSVGAIIGYNGTSQSIAFVVFTNEYIRDRAHSRTLHTAVITVKAAHKQLSKILQDGGAIYVSDKSGTDRPLTEEEGDIMGIKKVQITLRELHESPTGFPTYVNTLVFYLGFKNPMLTCNASTLVTWYLGCTGVIIGYDDKSCKFATFAFLVFEKEQDRDREYSRAGSENAYKISVKHAHDQLSQLDESGVVYVSTTASHDRQLTEEEAVKMGIKKVKRASRDLTEKQGTCYLELADLPPTCTAYDIWEKVGSVGANVSDVLLVQKNATSGAGLSNSAFVCFHTEEERDNIMKTHFPKGKKVSKAVAHCYLSSLGDGYTVVEATVSREDRKLSEHEQLMLGILGDTASKTNQKLIQKKTAQDDKATKKQYTRDLSDSPEVWYMELTDMPLNISACGVWTKVESTGEKVTDVLLVREKRDGLGYTFKSAFVAYKTERERNKVAASYPNANKYSKVEAHLYLSSLDSYHQIWEQCGQEDQQLTQSERTLLGTRSTVKDKAQSKYIPNKNIANKPRSFSSAQDVAKQNISKSTQDISSSDQSISTFPALSVVVMPSESNSSLKQLSQSKEDVFKIPQAPGPVRAFKRPLKPVSLKKVAASPFPTYIGKQQYYLGIRHLPEKPQAFKLLKSVSTAQGVILGYCGKTGNEAFAVFENEAQRNLMRKSNGNTYKVAIKTAHSLLSKLEEEDGLIYVSSVNSDRLMTYAEGVIMGIKKKPQNPRDLSTLPEAWYIELKDVPVDFLASNVWSKIATLHENVIDVIVVREKKENGEYECKSAFLAFVTVRERNKAATKHLTANKYSKTAAHLHLCSLDNNYQIWEMYEQKDRRLTYHERMILGTLDNAKIKAQVIADVSNAEVPSKPEPNVEKQVPLLLTSKEQLMVDKLIASPNDGTTLVAESREHAQSCTTLDLEKQSTVKGNVPNSSCGTKLEKEADIQNLGLQTSLIAGSQVVDREEDMGAVDCPGNNKFSDATNESAIASNPEKGDNIFLVDSISSDPEEGNDADTYCIIDSLDESDILSQPTCDTTQQTNSIMKSNIAGQMQTTRNDSNPIRPEMSDPEDSGNISSVDQKSPDMAFGVAPDVNHEVCATFHSKRKLVSTGSPIDNDESPMHIELENKGSGAPSEVKALGDSSIPVAEDENKDECTLSKDATEPAPSENLIEKTMPTGHEANYALSYEATNLTDSTPFQSESSVGKLVLGDSDDVCITEEPGDEVCDIQREAEYNGRGAIVSQTIYMLPDSSEYKMPLTEEAGVSESVIKHQSPEHSGCIPITDPKEPSESGVVVDLSETESESAMTESEPAMIDRTSKNDTLLSCDLAVKSTTNSVLPVAEDENKDTCTLSEDATELAPSENLIDKIMPTGHEANYALSYEATNLTESTACQSESSVGKLVLGESDDVCITEEPGDEACRTCDIQREAEYNESGAIVTQTIYMSPDSSEHKMPLSEEAGVSESVIKPQSPEHSGCIPITDPKEPSESGVVVDLSETESESAMTESEPAMIDRTSKNDTLLSCDLAVKSTTNSVLPVAEDENKGTCTLSEDATEPAPSENLIDKIMPTGHEANYALSYEATNLTESTPCQSESSVGKLVLGDSDDVCITEEPGDEACRTCDIQREAEYNESGAIVTQTIYMSPDSSEYKMPLTEEAGVSESVIKHQSPEHSRCIPITDPKEPSESGVVVDLSETESESAMTESEPAMIDRTSKNDTLLSCDLAVKSTTNSVLPVAEDENKDTCTLSEDATEPAPSENLIDKIMPTGHEANYALSYEATNLTESTPCQSESSIGKLVLGDSDDVCITEEPGDEACRTCDIQREAEYNESGAIVTQTIYMSPDSSEYKMPLTEEAGVSESIIKHKSPEHSGCIPITDPKEPSESGVVVDLSETESGSAMTESESAMIDGTSKNDTLLSCDLAVKSTTNSVLPDDTNIKSEVDSIDSTAVLPDDTKINSEMDTIDSATSPNEAMVITDPVDAAPANIVHDPGNPEHKKVVEPQNELHREILLEDREESSLTSGHMKQECMPAIVEDPHEMATTTNHQGVSLITEMDVDKPQDSSSYQGAEYTKTLEPANQSESAMTCDPSEQAESVIAVNTAEQSEEVMSCDPATPSEPCGIQTRSKLSSPTDTKERRVTRSRKCKKP